MTNDQWLAWFDEQSTELKRDIMRALDALENAGIRGKLAAETVFVSYRAGVAPASLAAVFAENATKH